MLIYASEAIGDHATVSKNTVIDIKEGRIRSLNRITEIMRERYPCFSEMVFPEDAILVPVPGSNKLQPGAFLASAEICKSLLRADFGARMGFLLERTTSIKKSAWCKRGERPRAEEHIASMRCTDSDALSQHHFVLVDDVVTKGTTLSASRILLKQSFPKSTISAFCIARTKKGPTELPEVILPAEFDIEFDGYASRAKH